MHRNLMAICSRLWELSQFFLEFAGYLGLFGGCIPSFQLHCTSLHRQLIVGLLILGKQAASKPENLWHILT